MPSVSKAQQRLMQAAEHGASFPMARKIQSSMTHDQMHDFAVGSMKDKPAHIKPKKVHNNLLHGDSADIISTNVKTLKKKGLSHGHATHLALKHAKKGKKVNPLY